MSSTRSEEDAVLDRLLTRDGVFAVEWQTDGMVRAYYMSHTGLRNANGVLYESVAAERPSAAYREAVRLETAARVAAKLTT